MNFAEFPFLRYLFFFISGILISEKVEVLDLSLIGWVLFLCWGIYLLILLFAKKKVKGTFAPLAYLLIAVFGYYLNSLEHSRTEKLLNQPLENSTVYLGEVLEFDLQKPNSKQNKLRVKQCLIAGEWQEVEADILIYHQLDSALMPGQVVLVRGGPELIPETTGPAQFDYKAFLLRKGIGFRQFVGKELRLVGQNPDFSFRRFLKETRNTLSIRIDSSFEDREVASVIKALLIGQKESLDKETRKAYGNAGVMHILAVSGLHVGIVYMIFLFLAKVLKLSGKPRKGYLLLVILFLWFYACLTGLSPSVVRASTMFSLLLLGQMRRSEPPFFNILGFSALLMIAYSPQVIYDVGFQLSYLAVGGIVLLQPLILNLWLPKNRVVEYFWQLTSVSLAAQLATFPLSVYYFNYFPTFFLIGNLLVLPLAFLIMQIGIPWLILGSIPWLGEGLAWVLDLLVKAQNFLIHQVSGIDFLRMDRLTIGIPTMLFIWCILLIITGWSEWKKKVSIRILGISVLVFLVFQSFIFIQKPNEEIIIYPSRNGFLVDFYHKSGLSSFSKGFDPEDISYSVDPYRIKKKRSIIPEQLESIGKDSVYYFPELGFSYNLGERLISFGESHQPRVYQWGGTGWEKISGYKPIHMEKNAIRILH